MLWVYGHYKVFNSFSASAVFVRQNLTYKDGTRAERVKTKVDQTSRMSEKVKTFKLFVIISSSFK